MRIEDKKIYLCMFAAIFTFTLIFTSIPARANELYVDKTTPAKIRDYYNKNGIKSAESASDTYSQKPSLTGTKKAGQLSSTTLNNALKTLNFMRYMAGVPSGVTLNSTYTTQCQTACFIDALNDELSHFPDKPSGVSESVYNTGLSGACSSNLAWNYGSLGKAIEDGWMNDSDDSNVSILGHRRWVLNPVMGKTGFGSVNGYMAMYAFDYSGDNSYSSSSGTTTYHNVVWPAAYTPTAYFSADQAWSISTGNTESKSKIKVTLTCLNNNKKWTFSSSSSSGDFYVDNQGYGQKGCIIFRPKSGMIVKSGYKYKVTVTGLSEGTLTYQVNFFSLNASIKNAKVTLSDTKFYYDGKEKKPKVTVMYGNTKLKAGTDYSYYYSNNVKTGKATVTVKGKNCYSGTISTTFSIVPGQVKITGASNVSGGIKLTWNARKGATQFQILRKLATEKSYTVIATTSNLYYTDTTAVRGRSYIYSVRGKCSAGCGKASSTVTVTRRS